MGIISKILHKDKHQDEDPVTATSSDNTTSSQNKPYYTGPNDTTSSTAGHAGHNTTTASHGLGSNTTSSGLGTSGTTGTHAHSSNTTAGPHSSNAGNRVDPRVDSDNSRYNSANVGGQHGLGSDSYGHRNEYNTTSGPHASNAANKVDPRVDSDNSRYTTGVSGSHGQFADTTAASGHHGYESTPGAFPSTGSGFGHSTGHSTGLSSQPHVDRDGYGSSTGAGQNFSGRDPYPNTSPNTRDTYGSSHAPGPYGTREDYGPTGPASHTLGPHSSNAANVVDPRVRPEPEKMRDHKTVGPHNSDMLNKLDPRVEADPRAHGLSHDPRRNDDHRYGSTDSGRQTGGFVGGPHELLENRGSIPTAGGLPVGADGNGPYGGGLTGSHGASHGHTGSHGGLTGSHGRDAYDSRANEAYGATDRFAPGAGSSGLTSGAGIGSGSNHTGGPGAGSLGTTSGAGFGSGSHHTGGHGALSDIEYKERELALRQKELDLKEREYRINAGH